MKEVKAKSILVFILVLILSCLLICFLPITAKSAENYDLTLFVTFWDFRDNTQINTISMPINSYTVNSGQVNIPSGYVVVNKNDVNIYSSDLITVKGVLQYISSQKCYAISVPQSVYENEFGSFWADVYCIPSSFSDDTPTTNLNIYYSLNNGSYSLLDTVSSFPITYSNNMSYLFNSSTYVYAYNASNCNISYVVFEYPFIDIRVVNYSENASLYIDLRDSNYIPDASPTPTNTPTPTNSPSPTPSPLPATFPNVYIDVSATRYNFTVHDTLTNTDIATFYINGMWRQSYTYYLPQSFYLQNINPVSSFDGAHYISSVVQGLGGSFTIVQNGGNSTVNFTINGYIYIPPTPTPTNTPKPTSTPTPTLSPTPLPTVPLSPTPIPTDKPLWQSYLRYMLIGTDGKSIDAGYIRADGSFIDNDDKRIQIFENGVKYLIRIPTYYYLSSDDFPIVSHDGDWTAVYFNTNQILLTFQSERLFTADYIRIPIYLDVDSVPSSSLPSKPWTSYFNGNKLSYDLNQITLDQLKDFNFSEFTSIMSVVDYAVGLTWVKLWFIWIVPIICLLAFFVKKR